MSAAQTGRPGACRQVRVAHHANMHLVIGAFLAREWRRNDGGANPRSEAQRTIGKRLEPLNRRAIDPATTLSRIPVVRRSHLDHQRHRDDADHCRFARIPGSDTVVVDTASTHARPKMPTPVELAIAAALTGQKVPEPDPIKVLSRPYDHLTLSTAGQRPSRAQANPRPQPQSVRRSRDP